MSQKSFLGAAGVVSFVASILFASVCANATELVVKCSSHFSPLVVQIDLYYRSASLCVLHGTDVDNEFNPAGEKAELRLRDYSEDWLHFSGDDAKRFIEIHFQKSDLDKAKNPYRREGFKFTAYLDLGPKARAKTCTFDRIRDCEGSDIGPSSPMTCERVDAPGDPSCTGE